MKGGGAAGVAQQAYRPHDRATWFFEFPAQCVVVIDLREWTTDTEAALLQAAGDPNVCLLPLVLLTPPS